MTLIMLVPITGAGRLFAQERKIQNRPFLDDRVWHYGFLVGFNIQDLKLANNGTAYVNQNGGTPCGKSKHSEFLYYRAY